MSKKLFLLSFSIILVLFSCESSSKEDLEKPYFDINNFVQNQVNYLNEKSPNVKKKWINNSVEEIRTLKIENWEREFEMLKNADINKKGLVKIYQITKNDSIESYVLKPNEKANVRLIEVIKDLKGNIDELNVTLSSDNYLFKSNAFLKFQLKNNHLKKYSISLTQKMIFGQEKRTQIQGLILNQESQLDFDSEHK